MESYASMLGMLLFVASLGSCYKIDGKVMLPPEKNQDWINEVQILVDGGKYRGYLRNDGSFSVHNVPSGSYIVEVVTPKYLFEPIRVDITTKGNIRGRKVNQLQPAKVSLVKYPLELKAAAFAGYFEVREKFSIFDMLKNPMVLMMVLPLFMLVVLPKMMNTNDPELRKEMEQSMKMFTPNQSGFDLSETLSSFFGGGQTQQTKQKSVEGRKKKK